MIEFLRRFLFYNIFIQIIYYKLCNCQILLDEEFKSRYPYDLDIVDKYGAPVLILPFGKWDIKRAAESGEGEKIKQHYIDISQECQALIDKVYEQTNGTVTDGIVVYDMRGYSIVQFLSPQTNQLIGDIAQYFEEHLNSENVRKWYMINSPPLFSIVVNAYKVFFSNSLFSKVIVYDGNTKRWKRALLQDIPADQLTPRYGGTKGKTVEIQN